MLSDRGTILNCNFEIMIPTKQFSLILFISFLMAVSIQAQHHYPCGTDGHLNDIRLKKHIETLEDPSNVPVRMTRYIPIKFFMMADDNGASRVSYASVFKQLCKLRNDYEPLGFIPYMDGLPEKIDHSGVNNSPNTNGSSLIMNGLKDPNAVNVFICKSADVQGASGTILGYYDPTYDLIVVRTAEVSDSTATLTHELGHYLSLNHPFFGWENEPYDANEHGNPISQNTINGYPIELVDGSNCTNSGDRVCDTPPDYLFSFSNSVSVSNCNMLTEVFDRNVDLIETMENNIMSYFECDVYDFTDDQVQLMEVDFESPARAHIRTGYVPNDSRIEEDIVVLSPPDGDVEVFNNILFDWEDVENADGYYIFIRDIFDFKEYEYFVEDSEFLMTEITSDSKVNWYVIAYNESWGCTRTTTFTFDTGTTSSTDNTDTSFSTFAIQPNPSNDQANVYLKGNKKELGTLHIFDITGAAVFSRDIEIDTDLQVIDLPEHLSGGMYIVKIETSNGQSSKKWVRR